MMERSHVTTLVVKEKSGVELWTCDYIGGLGHTREVQGVDELTSSVIMGAKLILFEGLTEVPLNSSVIWNSPSVCAVLGFGRIGCRRRRKFVKQDWKFAAKRITHGEVGGVTTAQCLAWLVTREGMGDTKDYLKFETMKNISGYSTIVDPVSKGGRKRRLKDDETDEGLVASKRRCLLDWRGRFDEVECQTVFHKGLVVRKLQPKELAVALDLPNSRVKEFKGDLRALIEKVAVPGKIVQSVARAVVTQIIGGKRDRNDEHEAELRKRKRLNPLLGMTRPDPIPNLANVEDGRESESGPQSVSQLAEGSTVTASAVKSDDAQVPFWLWDNEVLTNYPVITQAYRKRVLKSFDLLRDAMLGYWRRKVKRDFNRWKEDDANFTGRITRELVEKRGEEIFDKVDHASWWNWDKGSTLFFWRWPKEYINDVLYGGPVRFDREPEPWFVRAKDPTPGQDIAKMKSKLTKVLMKGYVMFVDKEQLTSLLNVFFVAKGADDLRGVYDATMSGLNPAMWTPWFLLPGPDTILRELLPGYWSTDNDYGEQFLNFPLNPALLQYAGIDLTKFFPELAAAAGGELFGVWLRNLMGLQCSPYISVMGASRAKRIILGDRKVHTNPFHWEKVELNLPGDSDYDCSKPRVMRVRHDGSLATAISKFVDDVRSSGSTRILAWRASTKTGKTLSWLGLQDAPRKRREASQEPGAWAGTMVSTTEGRVRKFVSQDRWDKTRERLAWFGFMLRMKDIEQPEGANWGVTRMNSPKGTLCFKTAERFCGFLRYVAQTYQFMVPYLKGIYNTLNIWRPHRDQDGWKGHYDPKYDSVHHASEDQSSAPTHVRFARRLRGDIISLLQLCVNPTPPKLDVRPRTNVVIYMSGDASGSGFGMMLFIPGKEAVMYSHGLWSDETSAKSSNYRESANLVLKLRDYVRRGIIPYGAEIFICTDNKVAERTYHKGSGGTKQLHELVMELRQVEMEGELHISTFWCAGTRLIKSGTDGLSRGDFSNGVLSGRVSFLEFIPWNKGAFERVPELSDWVVEHTSNMLLEWMVLTPDQWFDEAFEDQDGAFIWAPPPAAAQVALEQMCEVKHVRPDTSHIFIVPDLMAVEWEKRLRKIADIVIHLAPKSSLWGPNQHESLTLAFVCPFLVDRPFAVGRTDWVSSRGKEMSAVWEENTGVAGCCLRKFWLDAWHIDDSLINDNFMEEEDKDRFKVARDGDHLMTPFQCDDCHFENVLRRPRSGSQVDTLAMNLIRRANLDSMWSRERSTVYGNQREGVRTVIKARLAGISDPYPARGPTNQIDEWGMATAMVMLLRTLDEGKNAPTIQFDTARGVRTHMSNYWHASARGVGDVIVGSDGTVSDVSNAPTNSYWFRRFVRGCHRRMGDIWKPNRPMLIAELQACLALLEEDWAIYSKLKPPDRPGMLRSARTAALIIAGFFAALRGEEICRVDVGSMRKHWHESQHLPGAPHVPLMMAGRFKGDHTEKLFCQPLANVSKTGVTIKVWFERCLQILDAEGIRTGPMFRVPVGKQYRKSTITDLDVDFHWIIKRVQLKHANLIPLTGSSSVDVEVEFSCMRSLRRGATSHASNMGVPEPVVEANNRWRKHLRSRGMRPQMSMMERYSDAKASVPSLIRFSGGM